jgi:hypothetical protein
MSPFALVRVPALALLVPRCGQRTAPVPGARPNTAPFSAKNRQKPPDPAKTPDRHAHFAPTSPTAGEYLPTGRLHGTHGVPLASCKTSKWRVFAPDSDTVFNSPFSS